ncbi:MAG: alpha-amylase family glycosyl hydrolase [Sphingomicrobium sp.]
MASGPEWWRGAAIYQIYPRSFADSNGDGIGDLPGVTAKLGYVAQLGVDCVWLSPFFTSPMRDFGYDVSDYCDVDPIFGTLSDFDALAVEAHRLGLKLIIDQVYSHSSAQHVWFKESRAARTGAHADWYVWADAKADGSPPNNWQSVFGGPAWTWDARRGQYYLHNFLPDQPDLNVHNPDVQQALLDVARFWLDRGVDGFRLDAINFAMHDPELRDNPPAPPGGKRTRPFDFQHHLYNQSHPAIVGFIERLRALADKYDGRFLLAEVGGERPLAEMHAFTSGEHRLDSAYSFDFLYAEQLTPKVVADAVAAWPADQDIGWPAWAFENHDAPRAVSRWSDPQHAADFARLKLLLLACLRGTIILYQGEELGLTQVDVPFERLQDPEAIANWPLTLNRDGARTPMPWAAGTRNAGFSDGLPWLPLGPDHHRLAVDLQQQDPNSVLAFARTCLALRDRHQALRLGSMKLREGGDQLLRFEREHGDRRLLCTFNLSNRNALFEGSSEQILISCGHVDASQLGAYSAVVEQLP